MFMYNFTYIKKKKKPRILTATCGDSGRWGESMEGTGMEPRLLSILTLNFVHFTLEPGTMFL